MHSSSAFPSLSIPRRLLQCRWSTLTAALITISLTACTGPLKPVLTAEKDKPPAQPTEVAETATPSEPTPEPAWAGPEGATVPLPPIGERQPSPLPTDDATPVVEAKPVLLVADRESYTAPIATTATFVTTGQIPVNLAKAATSSDRPDKPLVVTVTAEGEVFEDDGVVARGAT